MAAPENGARRTKQITDASAVAKHLLQLEAFGVLDRHIVSHPILTDDEHFNPETVKMVPPRLFFYNDAGGLYHCYGDDKWYEAHPEYERGGLSYECILVDKYPIHLANYLAMEDAYISMHMVNARDDDPIHMRHRRYVSPEEKRRREEKAAREEKRRIGQREARGRSKARTDPDQTSAVPHLRRIK